MSNETPKPEITKDLLEYLESAIPMKDWSYLDSREDILYYSGRRAVVNHIKQLYELQKKKL